MDLQDVRALLTPEALRILDSLPRYTSGADVLRTASRLREQGCDPRTAAVVLTQSKLRARAETKFGPFAPTLLYTEDGLEQATRSPVAALHAQRLVDAGAASVADLGCGIAADARAFAAFGLRVIAVELEPATAAIAAFNLAPLANTTVEVGDAAEFDASRVDALFYDPARRVTGTRGSIRTWNPEQFSPPLDRVFDACRTRTAGVKLGPGFPHEAIPAEAEAQWIGIGSETVELTLWFGAAARPGTPHSARVLTPEGWSEVISAGPVDPPVDVVAAYLYEPHGAAIRARALGTLAREHGLHAIDGTIAYLSGDDAVDSPFLTRYRVKTTMPFDRKRLAKTLRGMDAGQVTVKKRGADVDPNALARQLSGKGSRPLTVVVTREHGRHVAVVADREPPAAPTR